MVALVIDTSRDIGRRRDVAVVDFVVLIFHGYCGRCTIPTITVTEGNLVTIVTTSIVANTSVVVVRHAPTRNHHYHYRGDCLANIRGDGAVWNDTGSSSSGGW